MRLSWSSSSRHIISASLDGIVRLWDSRSGVCERVFQGHSDSIQDMAITVYVSEAFDISIDGI
jgi:WD40 repeat protein